MRRILTLARSIAGKAVSNLLIGAASGVSRASGPHRRCRRCVVVVTENFVRAENAEVLIIREILVVSR